MYVQSNGKTRSTTILYNKTWFTYLFINLMSLLTCLTVYNNTIKTIRFLGIAMAPSTPCAVLLATYPEQQLIFLSIPVSDLEMKIHGFVTTCCCILFIIKTHVCSVVITINYKLNNFPPTNQCIIVKRLQ